MSLSPSEIQYNRENRDRCGAVAVRPGDRHVHRAGRAGVADRAVRAGRLRGGRGDGPDARVLVSSDDAEIKDVARSRKGVTVDDRAIALAGDTIKVVDVIHDLASRPEIQSDFDAIGMLLPTANHLFMAVGRDLVIVPLVAFGDAQGMSDMVAAIDGYMRRHYGQDLPAADALVVGDDDGFGDHHHHHPGG